MTGLQAKPRTSSFPDGAQNDGGTSQQRKNCCKCDPDDDDDDDGFMTCFMVWLDATERGRINVAYIEKSDANQTV